VIVRLKRDPLRHVPVKLPTITDALAAAVESFLFTVTVKVPPAV